MENQSEDTSVKARTITEDDNDKGPGFIETVIRNFPWVDLTMAFLIPKALFHYLAAAEKPFLGAVLGVAWAAGYGVFQWSRTKKLDWFSVLAVFMIAGRITSHFCKHSGLNEFLAPAVDDLLFGVLFLGSVFTSRSLVQYFVDKSNVSEIPEVVRKTPFYQRAWNVTSVLWGVVSLVQGGLIFYLGSRNLQLARSVDFISGWPTTAVLMMFCVGFPRWYWTKNWDKILKAAGEESSGKPVESEPVE